MDAVELRRFWHAHAAQPIGHVLDFELQEPATESLPWETPGSQEIADSEEPSEEPGESLGARGSSADSFVVLAVDEGGRWTPMHERFAFRPGALAAVAIHEPDEETALGALQDLGLVPHEDEPEGTPDADAAEAG